MPGEEIGATVRAVVRRPRETGMTSVLANRRVLRISAEPQELFRRCTAQYAREQAYCAHNTSSATKANHIWTR